MESGGRDRLTVVSRCDITEKEQNLLEALRAILYGEVVIYIQDGQPVRIVKVRESVKL